MLSGRRTGFLVGLLCLFGCNAQHVTSTIDTLQMQTFAENGGWCWFQDERAVIHNNLLVIGSLSGTGGGDVRVSSYNLDAGKNMGTVVLHAQLEQDDHDTPALFVRNDGSILAMYAQHFKTRDPNHYYRISEPDNPLHWGPEQQYNHGDGNWITYMNLYEIPAENTLYCFYRDGKEYQPTYIQSGDQGRTWQGGGLFISHGLERRHRPYARYTSNNRDAIQVTFTEAHPDAFDRGCSIYYAAFKNGNFYRADGSLIKSLKQDGPVTTAEADMIFRGDSLNNAWTSSIELDNDEYPHIGYSVHKTPQDHRYRYAWWESYQWQDMEIAYAGARLYEQQAYYTGLITLDPSNPRIVYISSDVDPATGEKTGTGKYEIYRTVIPGNATAERPQWQAVTEASTVDNIRPVCVAGNGRTVLLWMRGRYTSFIDYDTDIVGIILE
jgi:hypothetical protein